jgi:hypothetical protein
VKRTLPISVAANITAKTYTIQSNCSTNTIKQTPIYVTPIFYAALLATKTTPQITLQNIATCNSSSAFNIDHKPDNNVREGKGPASRLQWVLDRKRFVIPSSALEYRGHSTQGTRIQELLQRERTDLCVIGETHLSPNSPFNFCNFSTYLQEVQLLWSDETFSTA